MFFWGKDHKKQKDEYSLLEDLSHLQINTIVKDRIYGTSVPAIPEALRSVAHAYHHRIKEHLETTTLFNSDKLPTSEYFSTVLSEAKKIGDRKEINSDLASVVCRIERYAPELHEIAIIVEETGGNSEGFYSALTPKQLSLVQKCWELGTETIVMQTSISLSGDVVTRVSRAYSTPDKQFMMDMHSSSVKLSLKYWQSLVQTVTTLFKGWFSAKR
ncbi:hypothetical protein [Vibrio alfacsensis]|uniref:hypothetical protein n=1 Tax=Vibrio alfacsensis TaxID=1074311 RepID=UPI0040678C55